MTAKITTKSSVGGVIPEERAFPNGDSISTNEPNNSLYTYLWMNRNYGTSKY